MGVARRGLSGATCPAYGGRRGLKPPPVLEISARFRTRSFIRTPICRGHGQSRSVTRQSDVRYLFVRLGRASNSVSGGVLSLEAARIRSCHCLGKSALTAPPVCVVSKSCAPIRQRMGHTHEHVELLQLGRRHLARFWVGMWRRKGSELVGHMLIADGDALSTVEDLLYGLDGPARRREERSSLDRAARAGA